MEYGILNITKYGNIDISIFRQNEKQYSSIFCVSSTDVSCADVPYSICFLPKFTQLYSIEIKILKNSLKPPEPVKILINFH